MLFIDYLKQLEQKIYSLNNCNNNFYLTNFHYKKQNIVFWKLLEKIIKENKINVKENLLNELKNKIILFNFFNEDIIIDNNVKKNLILIENLNIKNINSINNMIDNLYSSIYNSNIIKDILMILSNEVYLSNLLENEVIFKHFINKFIVELFNL